MPEPVNPTELLIGGMLDLVDRPLVYMQPSVELRNPLSLEPWEEPIAERGLVVSAASLQRSAVLVEPGLVDRQDEGADDLGEVDRG